jgi:uncharacterized membrane protein
MVAICPPALIYLTFSFIQIIIDSFKGHYNTAFLKCIIMIMITILLNALCEQGLGVISWILIFIPFIMMTFVVGILLYVFGLDDTTGVINSQTNKPNKTKNTSNNSQVNIPYFYSSSPEYES